ncbi:hypothetical protein [Absidia glauca]|uniref:Uncharacterized protein n=1 Tax=Absidia glauca TaxID=4829 RepID=A0A168NI84_ABSGL|nr:hypothetical protein [Absidia glauca]
MIPTWSTWTTAIQLTTMIATAKVNCPPPLLTIPLMLTSCLMKTWKHQSTSPFRRARWYDKLWFPLAAVTKLMNEIISKVALGHELLSSPYKSRKQLEMGYPIKAMRYDTCTNGCMLFTDDKETECQQCQQPRYNDDNLANRTINVLSVAEQLGLLLYNKGTRQDLQYRSNYDTTGSYDDILLDLTTKDDQLMRQIGSRYVVVPPTDERIKEDHFTDEYDIAIGLYIGGFTPSSQILLLPHHGALGHLQLPSKHPVNREKKTRRRNRIARYSFYYTCVFYRVRTERMLQVCVMPGPKSPKGAGFWSFLRLLMDELEVLATASMVVTCDDGTTVRSKVHLLVATGDMPAAATLSGHSGHMST